MPDFGSDIHTFSIQHSLSLFSVGIYCHLLLTGQSCQQVRFDHDHEPLLPSEGPFNIDGFSLVRRVDLYFDLCNRFLEI